MDVPEDLLRPGLELALGIAIVRSRQRPPIPAPPALRPFLRFHKLPGSALATVRKVVEEDEELRTLTASAATEDLVNRASWLWLHRPEGWEAELAELVEASRAEAERDSGKDRSSARRLEAAEGKARRVGAELAALRQEVVRAQDGRLRAEADATRARTRSEELERAAARAKDRAERAATELEQATSAAQAAQTEAAQLRAALEEAERRLAEAAEQAEPVAEAVPPVPVPVPAPGAGGVERADGAPAPGALPQAAVEALGGAAAAAAALAASLRDLAGSFTANGAAASALLRTSPPGEPPPARAAARPAEVNAGRTPRRRALRIPRGMHVGTPEADTWLLTEADAAVLVDGYNVAKLGWPDQVLADQRERLLDVLDDLACRHSTPVEVVFDGADVGPVRSGRRRRVAVRFSPPAVPADDVIRELVAAHPATDPIIVVTNDRAVAHDVRAAGANVVSSDGLLAVARR